MRYGGKQYGGQLSLSAGKWPEKSINLINNGNILIFKWGRVKEFIDATLRNSKDLLTIVRAV
jgi:hypothetical protein